MKKDYCRALRILAVGMVACVSLYVTATVYGEKEDWEPQPYGTIK